MGTGWTADPEQIRAHAENVAMLRDRFAPVKSASSHITKNDAAYGMLCQWMAGILETKHTRQNELIAYVEENLALAAGALADVADAYDDVDTGAADAVHRAARRRDQ